jgi:hypothetical protein
MVGAQGMRRHDCKLDLLEIKQPRTPPDLAAGSYRMQQKVAVFAKSRKGQNTFNRNNACPDDRKVT